MAQCLSYLCITQGKAVVLQRKTEDGESVQVASLGPSEYFGKLASYHLWYYVKANNVKCLSMGIKCLRTNNFRTHHFPFIFSSSDYRDPIH